MKSANKSSDFLQIKNYLLLLQRNYQIKYLYMSKEKQETGYVYILTNPSFREDWVKIGVMGTGTLVHSLGSMNLSPMILKRWKGESEIIGFSVGINRTHQ